MAMTDASLQSGKPSATEEAAVLGRAKEIIDLEITGLEGLKTNLDHHFLKAIQLIEACQGRVIITGMGKSGHIGKKIAATLSSTGTPALFLHPAEGSHGDLGTLTAQDVVIAISNSGETPELLNVLPLIKRFNLPLIAMCGQEDATLVTQSHVFLNIAVAEEACPLGLAPTTSTTVTLALGDALAVVLLERKGFTEEDFALFHPAGALGKRLLLKVADLMHTGADIPKVSEHESFPEALMEMTSKKLGMTAVVNANGKALGVLTDGDLRRALSNHPLEQLGQIPLTDLITKNPKIIGADALAVSALRLMEEHKITVLLVLDNESRPQGVVHMHDILKTGIH